jgi:hypothetical protein
MLRQGSIDTIPASPEMKSQPLHPMMARMQSPAVEVK